MHRRNFRARSETEVKTPRAITSRSIFANQSSTWLSHGNKLGEVKGYAGTRNYCTSPLAKVNVPFGDSSEIELLERTHQARLFVFSFRRFLAEICSCNLLRMSIDGCVKVTS